MITISINGVDYTLKQKMSDFIIGEYETVGQILTSENNDKIEKYSNLFIYLGIPTDVIDDLDFSAFIKIVEQYNTDNELESEMLDIEKNRTIEIGGRLYYSFNEGESFKLTVKQMKHIEKAVKSNPNKYVAELMSVIFKDSELTSNEHYVDAHLKHKAKLFREQVTVDKALPFIGFFSKELLTNMSTYSTL